MNAIEEIKKARIDYVPQEYKDMILKNVKEQLVRNDHAFIRGARHFQNQVWGFDGAWCSAPYKFHAAIATWLQSLGFRTTRYYNKGGVDYALQVWI